jgi:hypothetical protein
MLFLLSYTFVHIQRPVLLSELSVMLIFARYHKSFINYEEYGTKNQNHGRAGMRPGVV